MQDWSMIPLHLRCTERNKIDPDYPHDDAKWWRFQEKWARRETFGVDHIYDRIPMRVIEFYMQQPEDEQQVRSTNIAAALRVTPDQFAHALKHYRRTGRPGTQPTPEHSGYMSQGEVWRDKYLQTLT